jgi:hypothetical protein
MNQRPLLNLLMLPDTLCDDSGMVASESKRSEALPIIGKCDASPVVISGGRGEVIDALDKNVM